MSGRKDYTIAASTEETVDLGSAIAGVAGVAAFATVITLGAAVIATGAVATAGVAATRTAIRMTKDTYDKHQERHRREVEARLKKEAMVQQRIAELKATRPPVRVGVSNSINDLQTKEAVELDNQLAIAEFRSLLPDIRRDYETLVSQQLLEASTVAQALQGLEQKLDNADLTGANAQLQALDQARIAALQDLENQWKPQFDYLQERLATLLPRLPQSIAFELQSSIEMLQQNPLTLNEEKLLELHQQMSEIEAQADRVQAAAEAMVKSWQNAGYDAWIKQPDPGDDGDVIVEAATHEGLNTQIRLEFAGQRMQLTGPHDESGNASCAARTQEAMLQFQAQGYPLEWVSWNDVPIPEEERLLTSAQINTEEVTEQPSITSAPQPRLQDA